MMERWTKRTDGGVLLSEEHEEKYTFIELIDILLDRLAYYEDMEEQGRLVVLPCKVGDVVYEVQPIRKRVQPLEIISVYIGRMREFFFNWELKDGIGIYQNVKGFGASQLGKTVFLTREEAEQALKGGANNA